jgi:hypothetical protein
MRYSNKKKGLATIAVHVGEDPDPVLGLSAPDIVMFTTFVTETGVPS